MKKKSGLADSPFFQYVQPQTVKHITEPAVVKSDSPTEQNPSLPQLRTDDTPGTIVSKDTNDTSVRTTVRTEKRVTKRHPFEIYEDQLVALQKLKAHSVLEGNPRTLADMVRVALDEFLEKQT